LIENSSIINFI